MLIQFNVAHITYMRWYYVKKKNISINNYYRLITQIFNMTMHSYDTVLEARNKMWETYTI